MNITAGLYKGRKLLAPNSKITRPTLSKNRMGVFNTLYSLLGEFNGKTFLDLFGGSGIMGLEALSRGFAKVKVVEINKKAADIIKKNYKMLNLEPDLIIGDSLNFLKNSDIFYDVIYIDPPYESGIYESVLKLVRGDLIITESASGITHQDFEVLKEKSYGNSVISYLKRI